MTRDNVLTCIFFILACAGSAVGLRWGRARRLIDEMIGDSSIKRGAVLIGAFFVTGEIISVLTTMIGGDQELIVFPVMGLVAGLLVGVFKKPPQW